MSFNGYMHTSAAVCIQSEIWEGNCGSYIVTIFTISEFKKETNQNRDVNDLCKDKSKIGEKVQTSWTVNISFYL